MGLDKRLLLFRGRTVIETTVASLVQGGLRPVVVVLEPGSPCRDLAWPEAVRLAENPRPERGMLSSIRAGLLALPPEVAAVAVLPGDHPFVPAVAVAELAARFRQTCPSILAPSYDGRRGHPLFLRADLFAEAMACDDAVGLRQLVRAHEHDLVLHPLEAPGAEHDLDRPEDLGRLR